MRVPALILKSKRVEFDGCKMVELQGYLGDVGVFKTYVKEELVPDNLENKKCVFDFDITLKNFKPCLKVANIYVGDNDEK